MALSGFDVLSSFLGGVQERAQEYDEDLAKRIKELADKSTSETTKTKYAEDYKTFQADKKLHAQVINAYAAGDHAKAQQLLGGYDSMEDYRQALGENQDLYYQMFEIGEEPKYTAADYGLTNVRDDGSQITTAGQMFDQFFRPEVHKARSDERVTPTVTAEKFTSYRRAVDADGNALNPRSEEDITESKSKISSLYSEMASTKEHDSKKDELETVIPDPENEGQFIKVTLTKNASYKETGKSAMDVAVNKHTGNVGLFNGYSASNWVNYEQAGAIPNGSEMEFVRQGVIVDKNDNILEQDMFLSTSNGESIDGRRFANVKVKAQRTGNPEDTIVMDGETLTGWRYMHELVEAEPAIARKAELTLHRKNTDDEGNDLLGTTKYTLTLTSDGSTGKTAKTFGVGENGNYTYKGYQVTDMEENFDVSVGTIQDYIEQRWVHNGEIIKSPYRAHDGKRIEGAELLDVKFKAKFTGEDSDSITYVDGTKDVGYKLIGQDIVEPTDTSTTSMKDLSATGSWLIADSKLRPDVWKEVISNIGYGDSEMTPHIAESIARTIDSLKLNLYDGTLIDTLNSLGDITQISDIPDKEDWKDVTLGNIQQYTYDYLRGDSSGTVKYRDGELPIFNNLVDKAPYESFINAYAFDFSNKHHVSIVSSVKVIEKIAQLGLKDRDMGFLNLKRALPKEIVFDSNAVLYRENNRDVTVANIVLEIEQFRAENAEQTKNYTWEQIADYVVGKVRQQQTGNN